MIMENGFTMSTLKQGRVKYLLLTVFPPAVVSYLCVSLTELGILPKGQLVGSICLLVWAIMMGTLGYFLIFKKNHQLDINDNTITETDWRCRVTQIPVSHVRSFRRNWLKEYILLDENGKRLVCIETNMENFDLFEQWIEHQHFKQMDKE